MTRKAIEKVVGRPKHCQFLGALAYYRQEVAKFKSHIEVHLDLTDALKGQLTGCVRRSVADIPLADPNKLNIALIFTGAGENNGGFLSLDISQAREAYDRFAHTVGDMSILDKDIELKDLKFILNAADPNPENQRVVYFTETQS